MSSAPTHKMTPDDLLRMPDDGKVYELVDGELVEKPWWVWDSVIATRIIHAVSQWRGDGGGAYVLVLVPFQCFGDPATDVRVPDAVYFSPQTFQTVDQHEEICSVVPDIAIEIICPIDSYQDMDRRRCMYLNAGVKQVWILNPGSSTSLVFEAGGGVQEVPPGGTLVGNETLMPGFTLRTSTIFDRN